jgi:hypothetical protein
MHIVNTLFLLLMLPDQAELSCQIKLKDFLLFQYYLEDPFGLAILYDLEDL